MTASILLCESATADETVPDPFAELTATEMARVTAVAEFLQFRAGDVVFRQGAPHEGIFVILSGQVRTYYIGPTGREITLANWAPGNFVGGPEIFGGGEHIWSGMALAPTRAMHLPGRALRTLMREIPNLAIGLVEALAHKGKCYSTMIHMLGTRSVAERLAQLILLMAERHGRPHVDGIAIARTLTHDDLAKMVGATRQWVTATLERLDAQGVIAMRRTQIVVLDSARLRRSAGCGEEIAPRRAHPASLAGRLSA